MPWLMKAEPDSRVVKGKDVKFSVDDFEAMGTSQWDGVRNHEAKNIMKSKMKVGDKVLFYHSNTKVPGVYALAEVAREGYPDYTAWDPTHPYYDPKSSQANPTWYMIDLRFLSRLAHPPTLALVRHLAGLPPSSLPDEVSYIGKGGLEALRGMALVNRGRLSVQPVDQAAFDTIELLGTKGGWEGLVSAKGGGGKGGKGGKGVSAKEKESRKRKSENDAVPEAAAVNAEPAEKKAKKAQNRKPPVKASKVTHNKPPAADPAPADTGKRRSKRRKP